MQQFRGIHDTTLRHTGDPAPRETEDDGERTGHGDGKSRAYNGGSLARAADIWEQMLVDKETTKFFGLADAMVPAGMGGIVADLIRGGHIDILVLDRRQPHARHHRGYRLPALPRHGLLQ